MNATPQRPFFDNTATGSPQCPAVPETPTSADAQAVNAAPDKEASGNDQTGTACVHEQPMSARDAACLAGSGMPEETTESPSAPNDPQEVRAEILPETDKPSGSAAKDAACVVGGAAIAAVGVPMLVLPGPGAAAIAGGAALAGKGVKGLAQRAAAKGTSAPIDVEASTEGPQSQQKASSQPASAQAATPPTADDVKQAAATAGKAALGAAALAAQAIASKAKKASERGNVGADALQTARGIVDKAASSPAAQSAAEATANAARTLADKVEQFARSHRAS